MILSLMLLTLRDAATVNPGCTNVLIVLGQSEVLEIHHSRKGIT